MLTRHAALLLRGLAVALVVALPASDAFAQYGSYRGSKYSGGFGGTGFTGRRQSRLNNVNVQVGGLFNPYRYQFLDPFGYGVNSYYTQPGFNPYVYGVNDYRRYGYPVRTVGVSPGAYYQPGGVSFGLTTRRGLNINGAFGRGLGGVATFGAYSEPYYGYDIGPGYLPTPFADPYVNSVPLGSPYTPTESYYTDDAQTARKLRQMMRDSELNDLRADQLPYRAARPVAGPASVSSPAAKARSVRLEQQGDAHFQARKYLKAFTSYKDAVDAAGDRAEPRAKLVVTYTAIGQYDRAVGELKTLLQVDPDYPRHFISLDTIFGDQRIAKESVKTQLAEWTVGHVADPERLMLLGAIMYFDGDIDRARLLFDNVALYDDLAPLAASFRRTDTVTVSPLIEPAEGPSEVIVESPTLAPPLPAAQSGIPTLTLPGDAAGGDLPADAVVAPLPESIPDNEAVVPPLPDN